MQAPPPNDKGDSIILCAIKKVDHSYTPRDEKTLQRRTSNDLGIHIHTYIAM